MLTLLLSAAVLANPITLWRGGPGDADVRYWAVSDTFLDAGNGDRNYGRDIWLEGGPNKTILIRFGDLNRVLRGVQVTTASLVLQNDMPGTPELTGAYVLDRPWQEGDGRRGLIAGDVQPPKPVTKGADWRSRGPAKWATPGAISGPPIPGVSLKREENGQVVVDGLGATLEAMRRQPATNYGIALRFSTPVRFRSAEMMDGGPRLQLETVRFAADVATPALSVATVTSTNQGFVATVVSRDGKTPVPPDLVVKFAKNGEPLGEARGVAHSGDGAVARFELSVPGGSDVGREDVVVAWIESRDDDPGDDFAALGSRTIGVGSVSPAEYAALGDAARFLNETAFPQSRFSFAREGVTLRVSLGAQGSGPVTAGTQLIDNCNRLLDALGVAFRPKESSGDLNPGMSGWGDTRDDVNLPKFLPMVYDPVPDPLGKDAGLAATDLLNATQVAMLELPNFKERLPKRIGVQFFNGTGEPLGNAKASLRLGGSDSAAEGPVGNQGSWIPVLKDALPWSGGTLIPNTTRMEFGIQKGALQTTVTLPAWRFVDSAVRSGAPVGFAKVYADLPTVAPDLEKDLAQGRAVGDKLGTPANELAKLTDGDVASGTIFAAGKDNSFELDLGRDRVIAAVEFVLEGESFWPSLEMVAYQTGQLPDEAAPIFSTTRADYLVRTRAQVGADGLRTLRITPRPVAARFLVIRCSGATNPVQVQAIRVFPGRSDSK